MKRDPNISKLIKESGVIKAPDSFSTAVMTKIESLPERKSYKPLIGRGGRILIILFVIALLAIAIFYTDPTGQIFGQELNQLLPERHLLQFHLNLDKLEQINASTGIASALVAMFVLILSDAGLSRRRHRLT